MKEIIDELFENEDKGYAEFTLKIIPTLDPSSVMGVRTPVLRKMAKKYRNHNEIESFLNDLPHKYFEENQLHGFIISECKDFDKSVDYINKFLPFVDNWATCDQTSPKIFKKHKKELLVHIDKWLISDETYTIRFGIGMLMQHFLDEDFDAKYQKKVASIVSDEYYVNMEIAWYMATALAKQWDKTIAYLEKNKMGKWVHNKTIQKGVESLRITKEQKDYLRTLRIK